MNRDFKGIWMPREVWISDNLNCNERCFLAEIDSLDKGRGCWAKNAHFSDLFRLSKSRCSEIINSLVKRGFITVEYTVEDGEKIRLLKAVFTPSESRQTPSESRQTPSESRQTPSEYRTPIYKDEIYIENTRERDARAYDFLLQNCPGRLEQEFLIKFKSQINDFENFVGNFNDKVDVEELAYRDSVLMARLTTYARNWISNQRKDKTFEQPATSIPKTFRAND